MYEIMIITKDEFLIKKDDIKLKIARLKEKRENVDTQGQQTLTATEEVFDFACKSKTAFEEWNLHKKKEILSQLGQNFILKDWVLAMDIYPWFKTLINELENEKGCKGRLEPTKK